jgi:hypothetical protein
MDDHELGLKPVVTTGDPPFLRNPHIEIGSQVVGPTGS